MINQTTAKDKVDLRNYQYDIFMWGSEKLPFKYIIQDNKVVNQGESDLTKYWCVAYSTTNWINEIQSLLKEKDKDPLELFNKMVELWRLNINWGAYLIDWPKTAKELKWITWYAIVKTLEEIKHSLYKNRPLVVWSNKANWKTSKKEPYILEKWKSYWHRFLIVWYDDNTELLTCENSYWIWRSDNWRFYIRYKDIDILYKTKISLINEKLDILDLINKERQRAKKLWYKAYMNEIFKVKKKYPKSKIYKIMQQAARTEFLPPRR